MNIHQTQTSAYLGLRQYKLWCPVLGVKVASPREFKYKQNWIKKILGEKGLTQRHFKTSNSIFKINILSKAKIEDLTLVNLNFLNDQLWEKWLKLLG